MGVAHLVGSIAPGKIANLIVTDPGWNLTKIPYHYRSSFIRAVILRGQTV